LIIKKYYRGSGGGGSRARGRGSSGPRSSVRVLPQILEWSVRTVSVSEDNLPTSVTYPNLTNTFSGSNFTDVEQRTGLHAFARFSNTTNERATYYVTLSSGSSSIILVFTIVANTNTGELQVQKIGTPTSTLITDTEMGTINQRLSGYNITFSGSWTDEHRKITLTALNLLSEQELEKLRDLQILRRGTASSSATGRDAARVGGHYDQDSHSVTMFNITFTNGPIMVYGTDPAQMYPSGIHAVLHELGQAIVYSQVRTANAQAQTARRDFDAARRRMRSNWPEHYSETEEADGGISYNYDDPRSVPEESRSAYQADLRRLQSAEQSVQSAQQGGGESTGTQAFTRFQQAARNLSPVTPYSRDEAQAATDEDQTARALEEFLVESFAIYKWDSAWLQTNRQAVYNYFNQNQHL